MRRIDFSSVQTASSEYAREINRDIVLELIRFRHPVYRQELSRLSGLQPSTVGNIVEELVKDGWVREGALVQRSRGRPSVTLEMNDRLVTFALDVRPERTILAVVDLDGRLLSREAVVMVSDPHVLFARIVDGLRALRKRHSDRTFEGIGISLPGRVHPDTQRLLWAPNLSWKDFDIKELLEQQLNLQVEIDNDANACLLAESWSGRLTGVSNAVLVAISEGIGAAILSGGQLHSGHNGLAGEFGHLSIDPEGPVCGCGQRGCWEMMGSSRAAVRIYRELAPNSPPVDIFRLHRLAEENDPTAVEALSRQAAVVGRGLRLIIAGLSPELILIAGDITSSWPRFGPIIQKAMEAAVFAGEPPMLAPAGDAEVARLRGAAAMLLQRHARYHRSTHVSEARRRLPSGAARILA
jgi:predicted NBD/HSP70 family sugar kinase